MRTIAVIGAAFVGAALLSFPSVAQQKTVKACTRRMAGEQGRKPGQGRYAQGLRDAVPRGRRGTDRNAAPAATASQKTTAAAPAATGQKTVKACVEEWRANKAANEAKGDNAEGLCCGLPHGQDDGPADAVPDDAAATDADDDSAAACCSNGTATDAAEVDDRGGTSCGDGTDGCKPVRDGRAGQVPLRRRNGCVGQSRFKDLSLQRQQDLWPDQSGRVYVRAGCPEPGHARREKREASLK